MEKTSYYKEFVAQKPEAILQSVFKNELDILISVSLNNGNYLQGVILDISKENDHQLAVCMLTHDEQVVFFYAHHIITITVKQPKKMVVDLSQGVISRPMTVVDESLTVLQLKRWLEGKRNAFGANIKDIDVNSINLQKENNRLNIQDIFKALKIAVERITIDALGKKVWEPIQTILLLQETFLYVEIKATTLTISLDVEKALPKALDAVFEEKLLQIL